MGTPLYEDPQNDPDAEAVAAGYLAVRTVYNPAVGVGYGIATLAQLHILESAKRTAATARLSRADAIGMLVTQLTDGSRRDDQFDTLLLYNDAPEGIAP